MWLSAVGFDTKSLLWLGRSGLDLSWVLKGCLEGISKDNDKHDRSKKDVRARKARSTATLKRRPEEEVKDAQGRKEPGDEQATEDAKGWRCSEEGGTNGVQGHHRSSQVRVVGCFIGDCGKHRVHSSLRVRGCLCEAGECWTVKTKQSTWPEFCRRPGLIPANFQQTNQTQNKRLETSNH